MVDSTVLATLIALSEDGRMEESAKTTSRFTIRRMRVDGNPVQLIDARGPGKLHEASIRFTGNIILRLETDGMVISGSFDALKEYSTITTRIDAFEDDGDRVIRLSDIPFYKHLSLILNGVGEFRAVLRWDETPK